MIVARVEIEAFLHCHGARNVLPAVPVQAIGRCSQRLPKPLDLFGVIASPGRVADLGHPDLRAPIVAIEHGPHFGEMFGVTTPGIRLAVPVSGKAVNSARRYSAEYTTLAHQFEPVRIER